jgi:hypothetical protein
MPFWTFEGEHFNLKSAFIRSKFVPIRTVGTLETGTLAQRCFGGVRLFGGAQFVDTQPTRPLAL